MDEKEQQRRSREECYRRIREGKAGNLGEDTEDAKTVEPRKPEVFNRTLPKGKEMGVLQAAQKIAGVGINTPEVFAEALEDKFDGKLRPFTQSIWALISAVDATAAQNPNPDWAAVYAEIERRVVAESTAKFRAQDHPGC